MFIFEINPAKSQQRYVIGGGIFDWISRAVGSAGSFISANKDTIKNVADVVGNVAKAGTTTASAVKEMVDALKAKRAAKGSVPIPMQKALNEKSTDFLQKLAASDATPAPDINSRIAGAGFKTLAPAHRGRKTCY